MLELFLINIKDNNYCLLKLRKYSKFHHLKPQFVSSKLKTIIDKICVNFTNIYIKVLIINNCIYYFHESNTKPRRLIRIKYDYIPTTEEPIIKSFQYISPILLFVAYVCVKIYDGAIVFGQLGPKDITFVVVSQGEINLLKTSIESVLSIEHYGKIAKKIIVYDGLQTQHLDNLAMTYQKQQIKWIITNGTLGEVASIDLGLQQVTTSYVFLSNGLWNYTSCLAQQISQALILMQSQDKISQVIVTSLQFLNPGRIQLLDSQEAGFHIGLPSLMKTKQYKMIQGGFTHLTNNISYGQSLGRLSVLISMHFYQQGYYSYMLTNRCGQRMCNRVMMGTNMKAYQGQEKNKYRYQSIVQGVELCEKNRLQEKKAQKITEQYIQNYQLLSNHDINIPSLGFDCQIQICSQFDYMNITQSQQFNKIKQLFPKVFVENPQFFDQPSNNDEQSEQVYSSSFENIGEVIQFIKQKKSEYNNADEQQKLKQLLLQNPNDKQIYEAEQTYYQLKYGINKSTKNAKMCIFIQGCQLSSRMNISRLLLSISKQSYSNYNIVIVIEDQIGVNTNTYFHSLVQIYPNLKKHLKIITANQNVLGTPANYYVRARKYCRGTDIVVSVNGNSSFVGSQAFRVINSVYDNQEAWMAVFMEKGEDAKNVMKIINNQGTLQRSNYNPDTHLITFRHKLLEYLPIQQLLEFKKEAGSEYLIPNFYKSQSNKFHVYPLVQMSGIEHIRFSTIPIYDYHELDYRHEECWKQQQKWIQTKSLIKYPLNKLEKLGDVPSVNFEYILSDSIKNKVLQAKQHYISCLTPQPPIVKSFPFSSYLNEAINNMEESEYYIPSDVLNMEHPHLPFCIFVDNTIQRREQIRQSIIDQNYSNYSIIFVQQNSIQNQILIEISKQYSTDSSKQKIIWVKRYNYDALQQIMKQICIKNSLVMIVSQPLQAQALIKLNKIHQERNCWLTYSFNQKFVRIHSFYSRVFQLVALNDFQNFSFPYLQQGDKELLTLCMLELCQKVSMRLNFSELFVQYIQNKINEKGPLSLTAQITNNNNYRRQKYQPLLQLSQDYKTDTQRIEQMLKQVKMSKQFPTRPRKNSFLTKMDYFKALEYEQIAYLPDNHLLNLREYHELNKKYQINKYRGEGEEKMCVILLGRNNVARNRYVKNLMSIFMQNYTNFHVVYLDDCSNDGTLEKAIKFTKDQRFPNQKIIFIKNNKQVYATYNIINANFNFCDQDQIVVRVDSDDELLGRNVLSFINSIYKKYPDLWVVYANNDKNSKQFGMSTEIKTDEETRTCAGSRMHQHIIAHLTTWRVKLFRSIPLAQHLQEDGNWLKTLSDDASQFPMIQLATMRRVKYVPYICYFYHDDHGTNDHSNRDRVIERQNVFFFKLSQQPLEPLQNFSEQRTRNEQVANILKNDYGTVFELAL